MSDRRQQGEVARWRQVLRLGEELLSFVPAGREADHQAYQALHDLIVEKTARYLDAEATLWLAERLWPGTVQGRYRGEEDEEAAPDRPEPPSEVMRRSLQAGGLLGASVGTAVERIFEAGEFPQAPAVLAAPLLTHGSAGGAGEAMGVLQVERPPERPFQPEEIELFDDLALQVSLAMQTFHQTALDRWRVEQLALVRQVGEDIADLRGIDELAREVTRLILDTFDYYYVAIFTLEPGEEHLHFRASAGPRRKTEGAAHRQEGSPVLSIRLGEGLIGQVAETGEEILAGDITQDPRFRYLDALPETRSEFTLPLKIDDRVLGVMDVQSDQTDDFQETDLLVLRALAGNIAIAVEDTHLYSALQQRAEQLSTLYEVSNAIASVLDQDALFNEVVNLIQKRFGYSYVHLFTVHPGRRKVFYEAGTGERSRLLLEQMFTMGLDDPQGIVPWVARNGETVLANDVGSEPRYLPSPLPPENTRSELAVPVIFGGEVLGVLDVQSDRPGAFGEEDLFLFEALADNVAVALRNATLYRSELWRRQVADSLREVAGLLSADVDLDQVLDAILVELERTLPSDVAAIWLLDENLDRMQRMESPLSLRLAAARVDRDTGDLPGESGSIDELLRPYYRSEGPPTEATVFEWLELALWSEGPIVRSGEDPYEPLGASLDFPEHYSAIAAPLKVGDQVLGVLSLVHHTAGRYGTESRAMTAAFASYASVAIENARLYEAAHEQAWISTVLLQVSDATQSITNLNDLLATVVRITPMLVGVKACALYVWDELSEAFVPASASGLEPAQQIEFERWRYAPGEIPAFDQVRESHAPLILGGAANGGWLEDLPLFGLSAADPSDSEMVLLVPLISREEVLGIFLIDYSNGQVAGSYREDYFDERLAIIQGIAYQTSLAVENIRLLKAQKEEAYVSVALLQVAQAVVSLNDLDDILGAVVRITPILVGVRRSVLYLWNASQGVFRLSESYGVPRDSGELSYAAGEFPLLDAVLEFDRLMAAPLGPGALPPEAEDLDPPEAWTYLPASDIDAGEVFLEDEEPLLLAFPLSARGEVLGVLLVEEPDPISAGEAFTRGSIRRLREKRLEITTGISQQAALAIQNDRLQQETVARERMERELQLAREIQRTFLSGAPPEIPGWDISVRWRTAREVGGDFYDFFNLPGGRVGLIIADVADKGMPAALFMTMIRTSVRATVLEFDSPADVLERVNDLLVPDAQQGMFVTAVYAVLSPETGELTYANAGHNPPLWLHSEIDRLERLEKGGMALGVSESNRVEEHTVRLAPGDFVTFYTDGVTEAFSPDGEMFGDEHLYQAIRASDRREFAADILNAVDDAVCDFLEGSIADDDLTLMVLKRRPPEVRSD